MDYPNEKPLLVVISQGCAANFGDGEKIARIFANNYRVVFGMPKEATNGETEKPAAFVLNVCTVKGNASALKLLREAMSTAPEAKLFVTGCAPKDFREDVARISNKVTFTSLKELQARDSHTPIAATLIDLGVRSDIPLRESPLVGIVNIEEGCLDACAYCSTRLVKGRLYSYPVADIVQQVKNLVADGCVEIQLTGQDCGCYGFDTGTNLAELVQRILDEVPGDYKIRLGMGNPRHMLRYTDSLLKCFDDERVYKFIHLPVQSGSEDILKAMNRKHSAQDYVDLAEAFNRIPRFTLSTDLIVGFPGESERDFLDTLALLEKTRPTVCNITRFVPRPNTPAYNMTGAVPDSIKHERSAALAEAFQQIAAENNSRWIGTTETVVIEKNGYRKGTYIARNAAYRPVAITSEVPLQSGKRFTVTITAAEPFALIGERI
ncbi:tRNA (N(6)-L-threonylcarbamoyladenosine(37)-C(2))-methylthiotransferase [Fibrobacter sp.]|uniref:tRNA (N(6)-L-threonylcarbamoyladenosine(37)-C(2))- methylthiotransferase n=1 Tax=Fibrobacter sp. TaxID=35828 RepID=UPI0026168236|nr:tRNA (N(6)-L-threonylcarbamoyladenosine(37)-C(2))-methylthiotransferase [Fibrobacter sp.]MDD7498285.1 tRNA (N(6)-L-threonylcarbamoyladenosine(37)-C(2))-methylthiotransferase [Fibrobacter sp.]MDY5724369.1 tRNA (N(6)-L-threonylcarbamoyladenosine(37)-C(2))-methylthiotransferase [Fibrobacter sp.]